MLIIPRIITITSNGLTLLPLNTIKVVEINNAILIIKENHIIKLNWMFPIFIKDFSWYDLKMIRCSISKLTSYLIVKSKLIKNDSPIPWVNFYIENDSKKKMIDRVDIKIGKNFPNSLRKLAK